MAVETICRLSAESNKMQRCREIYIKYAGDRMANITLKTEQLINKYFAADEKDLVVYLLISECGNNLPFCEDSSPKELERIRFATIKLSNGDLNGFGSAIDLAKTDWKDLLVYAEFADDQNAHNTWAKTAM